MSNLLRKCEATLWVTKSAGEGYARENWPSALRQSLIS
jgi:hypothetical protein